jgi:hypothetical protein
LFKKSNEGYMNYKDLEIWQISRELVIELHKMSLDLPKFVQRTPSEKCMKKAVRLEDPANQ